MRKTFFITMALVCTMLLATACKVPDLQSTTPPPPPATVEAPKVVPVKRQQAPDDIKLVTAAIIEKLRGGTEGVQSVTFDPAGRHLVGEKEFKYEGFDVKNVSVTGYNSAMLESGKAQAMLEGVITFKDMIGRRASAYFATQYILTRESVTITKSFVAGIPSDFPRVETFFVPEKALRSAASKLVTYVDYYLFAIENAEPMAYGEGASKTGLQSKYYIMTFCKDRIFQESTLGMKVTSRAYGAGKKMGEGISINDSGWRILIAGGKFKPGSATSRFYVGDGYKQDAKTDLPSVVVGEFHNVKQTLDAALKSPAAAAAAQRAATAPAKVESKEGPYATGESYLNPVFPDDVEVIQVRLKQLGHYKAKIDKNFGPLTKKALGDFAQKNGFPRGEWNIGIQKALFKGTGL